MDRYQIPLGITESGLLNSRELFQLKPGSSVLQLVLTQAGSKLVDL